MISLTAVADFSFRRLNTIDFWRSNMKNVETIDELSERIIHRVCPGENVMNLSGIIIVRFIG